MKRLLGERSFLGALMLLGGSAVVFLVSAARAVQLESIAAMGPPNRGSESALGVVDSSRSSTDVLAAVTHDPFLPERTPRPTRYQLPVPDSQDSPNGAAPASPAQPELVLIGVALLPEGRGVALCRLGTDPARLVRLGERIGDYRLSRVEPGRAVFLTTDGRSIDLVVRKAGS